MKLAVWKYLALYIIGILVLVIVAVTILIQTFGYTNSLARSLFSIIGSWPVALNTFRFIVDWAEVLSAFSVCLVLTALLTSFRKYRRNRALNRLHVWSKNAVVALADYRQKDSNLQDLPLERYKEIRALIDRLKVNSRIALSDAQVLGGRLGDNTKKAVYAVFAVEEKVEKQDESAFEDLRALQHGLADIMISAFESLQREGDTWLFAPRK